jgi:solute carrier family 25 phosphate transporter 3
MFIYFESSKILRILIDFIAGEVEYGSLRYFLYCGLGGILSCGLTHALVVPLDLIKCRMQVDPTKYTGFVQGFKVTVAENGPTGQCNHRIRTFE